MIRAVRSTARLHRGSAATDRRSSPARAARARLDPRRRAFTSVALLDAGHAEEVRDFHLRWYATFQFPTGRIPCCIDRRGADRDAGERQRRRVPVHAAAVPATRATSASCTSCVRRRRAPPTRSSRAHAARRPSTTATNLPMRGLLPESISHEGYSGHPARATGTTSSRCAGSATSCPARGRRRDERAALANGARGLPERSVRVDRAGDAARRSSPTCLRPPDLGDFDATSSAARR